MKRQKIEHVEQTPRQRGTWRRYGDGYTYVLRSVSCGKKTCKKCRGRAAAHGPYWYAAIADGASSRYVYIGAELRSVREVKFQRKILDMARRKAKRA